MALVRLIRVGSFLALLAVVMPALGLLGCVLAVHDGARFGLSDARWTLKNFTVDAWGDVPARVVRLWRMPW